jgi:aldehyde:ferredoxin oxidoreductase
MIEWEKIERKSSRRKSVISGYMGKLLFGNLSSGKISEEELDEKMARQYLGGYGLGARIIYSRQQAGVDPLGPENTLGFVTGPFTGTAVPTGARYEAVGKSPLTGGWGDANSGGFFGPYLKFAGYDAVFLTGISPKPVYLLIDEGKAELKDASALWGKDAYETEDTLMAQYGKDSRVACIGPAGEKLSLIACIMTDRGSAAGRSGLGAVMGSKKLKAVVAKGTKTVPIADKAALDKLRMEQIKTYQTPGPSGTSFMESHHKYGTSAMSWNSARSGDSPVRNWGGVGATDLADDDSIKADNVAATVERLSGCWHCPLACKAYLKEGAGDYKYAAGSRRPEYETQASFGSNCGNVSSEAVNMCNDICNRYGLDTISAGTVMGFAIELYENGILTKQDTGGINLKWGDPHALVAMTEKMAKSEGIGAILALGVKAAAEKIGKGAEKYAVHIGGQELGMHDPKLAGMGSSMGAARYQMDATPGRHTQGFGPGASRTHFINSTGLCLMGAGFGPPPPGGDKFLGMLNAITGWDCTPEEIQTTGERIGTLRHAFNLREGINPLKWFVHPRIIGDPPQDRGPLAGVRADIEAQNYWGLGALDWDRVTAKPSKAKLLKLGLDDVAQELWPPQPGFGPPR